MYLAACGCILEGMDSGERWKLGHRPGLDGLRGVAILLVVACHLSQWWWPNALGSIGVTVFFTLSGFLITSLLLEESAGGRVSLRRFYGRRARRLFPALSVVVAVAGTVTLGARIAPPAVIGWVLLYVENWFAIGAAHVTGMFGHMWSLAIEEQFYLVWPVVLIVARRWRHGPLAVVGVGIVASVVLRFVLWDGGSGLFRVYFGSDTRADSLLVGCGVAILLHSVVQLRVPGPVALGAGGVALAGLGGFSSVPWVSVVLTQTLVPWVTALLLVHALTGPRWLTGAVLGWFGRRSYGIYLWNWPLVFLTAMLTGRNVVAIGTAMIVGLGVAELSWRYVEQPFMRAARWGRRAPAPAAVAPAYGV